MRYIFANKFISDNLNILDVACGVGYGSYFLAISNVNSIIYGVDISDKALKIAKKYYICNNVKYIKADVLNMPFEENRFDLIISFETIEHIKNGSKYLMEVKRVLKEEGIFICSTPNKEFTSHPKYHVNEYLPEEFYLLLQSEFKHVKKYFQFTRAEEYKTVKEKDIRQKGIISGLKKIIPFKKQIKLLINKFKSQGLNDLDIDIDIDINPFYINGSTSYDFENVTKKNRPDAIKRILLGVCKDI